MQACLRQLCGNQWPLFVNVTRRQLNGEPKALPVDDGDVERNFLISFPGLLH
jgi:hypothetical protein